MSIFELVNELNIQKEYEKFNDELLEKSIYFNYKLVSIFDYLDKSGVFRSWKDRDTFLSVSEYLEFIGVVEHNSFKTFVSRNGFLYYMEFLVNIFRIAIGEIPNEGNQKINCLMENINIILDKMGYKLNRDSASKRITINRKDSDLDSVVNELDLDLATLLISYNDFRIEKDISKKHPILKKIDLYIEENKKVLKEKDGVAYELIQKIVNNFGINHPIKSDDIKAKGEKVILSAYDDCFKLMIHLIRSVEYSTLKEKYANPV